MQRKNGVQSKLESREELTFIQWASAHNNLLTLYREFYSGSTPMPKKFKDWNINCVHFQTNIFAIFFSVQ